ncbi:MAG: GntR family transcriptional regulator [Victivallales bacterium]|nr:GntR family transcriptional regulator [Victivallales bacterium]
MNLIYLHPGETVMIPSSKELAAMFNVARSTVTLVLQKLVAEGYLEGKRGIGTFIKHENFIPIGDRMAPLVGLLAGDGKYFYYPHQVWAVMASCGMELTAQGYNVRPLTLTGMTEEDIFQEISLQYLDGLAWFDSSPRRSAIIHRLKNSGLKFVVQMSSRMDETCHNIDSFSFDFYSAGLELGRILLSEERRHLFFIFENSLTSSILEGIRRIYDDAGSFLRVNSFDWSEADVFTRIEAMLADSPPDSLYVHGGHLEVVAEICRRRKINAESCLMIAEAHVAKKDFHGYLLDIPFEQLGRKMATHLSGMFNQSDLSPVGKTSLPVKISYI